MHPFGLQAVTPIQLIRHAPGARGLRWTRGRSFDQLRRLLADGDAVVSLWHGKCLVAFTRATSDSFSRAVLCDIVVAGDLQSRGHGQRVVEEPLYNPSVTRVVRVDLMTDNSAGFYRQLGFRDADPQQLLVLKR